MDTVKNRRDLTTGQAEYASLSNITVMLLLLKIS